MQTGQNTLLTVEEMRPNEIVQTEEGKKKKKNLSRTEINVWAR